MMSSFIENGLKVREEIDYQLKQMNLKVVEFKYTQENEEYVVLVQDSLKEYILLLLPLSQYKSFNEVSCQQNDLGQTINLNHPNIIQIYEEFQIGNYCAIKMEKWEVSLKEFIQKNKNQGIVRKLFLDIALGILKAVEYLHSQQIFIKKINLKNIYLDEHSQIKLLYKNFHFQKLLIDLTEGYLDQTQEFEYLLTPQIHNYQSQKNNKIINFDVKQGDIWLIGIVLYAIAGASNQHINQFTSGEEDFQYQLLVDIDINILLKQILQRNPKHRLSINEIINLIENLKHKNKEILNKQNEFQEIEIKDQLMDEDMNSKEPLIIMLNSFLQIFFWDITDKNLKSLFINEQKLEYLYSKGLYYKKQQQLDDSLSYFELILQIDQSQYLAYFMSGLIYFLKQQLKNAAYFFYQYTQLSQIKDTNLDPIDIYLTLQSKEQLFFLAKIIKNNQIRLQEHYKQGLIYFEQEEYDEAIKELKKVISINPYFYKAFKKLGIAYVVKQEYTNAIFCLKKVLERNKNSFSGMYYLGIVFKEIKLIKAAIQHFKICLQIQPNKIQSYFYIGFIYYEQNQVELALFYLKQGFKRDNFCYDINCLIGNIYFENQQYEKAIKYYAFTILASPQNPQPYCQIGLSYFHKLKFDYAIYYLKMSLEINPIQFSCNYIIGLILYLKSINRSNLNLQEAIQYFQQAISIDSSFSQAFLFLGICQFKEQLYLDAIKSFKKAFKLNEKCLKSLKYMLIIFNQQSNYYHSLICGKKLQLIDPKQSTETTFIKPNYDLQKYEKVIQYLKKIEIRDPQYYSQRLYLRNSKKSI